MTTETEPRRWRRTFSRAETQRRVNLPAAASYRRRCAADCYPVPIPLKTLQRVPAIAGPLCGVTGWTCDCDAVTYELVTHGPANAAAFDGWTVAP